MVRSLISHSSKLLPASGASAPTLRTVKFLVAASTVRMNAGEPPSRCNSATYWADGCTGDGYIEGSEGQYSFMVGFNALGLFNAMGSRSVAVARLDRHFQQLNDNGNRDRTEQPVTL